MIREIVPGGPADQAKTLKPGDKIVGVANDINAEPQVIIGKKLRDVVKEIRGKAGTKVKLEVVHKEGSRQALVLTRQRVELQDREAQGEMVVAPHPTDPNVPPIKVGVIKLPSFYADPEREDKSATAHIRKICQDFESKQADVLVIDLRTNGGGLLEEARTVTGLFINRGPVVQVKNFEGEVDQIADTESGVAWSKPIIVLVSKMSASASEILAGALQDYGRALIVGDTTTHGKGSVQRLIDIAGRQIFQTQNMGQLKLTLQLYYRVNGDSCQAKGVASDVIFSSLFDHVDFSESKMDYALPFNRIERANFAPSGVIDPSLVKMLQDRSNKRQQTIEELVKYNDQRKKWNERRDRKSMTFTLDTLKQERKDLTDDEKEEKEDDFTKKKEKKFGEDPYTREITRIAADYVLLQRATVAGKVDQGQIPQIP